MRANSQLSTRHWCLLLAGGWAKLICCELVQQKSGILRTDIGSFAHALRL
jgi:hypothetical protein